ncbi:MAG: LysM peptidoglycan-binding domain-containing protein [Lachnospiraceae bacterium]|nr:LysM peptidoglycan-binding domain-containing protein [Lachnospiraceae bacterium]
MKQCRGFLHTVARGDTLYLLSRCYGVPLSSILLANPYVNVYNLQPGDEICIPRKGRPRVWNQEMRDLEEE